jgi:hypothetical protein
MPVTTNSVGIDLISDIRPKNDADHGMLQDQFLIGGFRRVQDLAARNAIPSLRREIGMFVFVIDDEELWRLAGGLLNTNWVQVPLMSASQIKSGTVLPVAFSGTPKVASVVFGTAFSSANYSITVDVQSNGTGKSYGLTTENRTAAGFTINTCSDTITGIDRVHWQAILEGS